MKLALFTDPHYCDKEVTCRTRRPILSYGKIREAMERIGKKLANAGPDDLTLETVDTVLRESAERAAKIKDGSYDFSLDEAEEDSADDSVPEELLETEEDKALDRRDEERSKRFDKIFNWITLAVFLAAAVLIVYNLVERLAT